MNQTLHLATPLVSDTAVAARLGKQILLKMECAQPIGSFKIRGIGLLCQREAQAGATKFVSSSGGNAGLAVAHAGRLLHVPVCVVVPTTTPEDTRSKLAEAGAEVIVHGVVWDDADIAARALAQDSTAAYIPPFDHPIIWEGHSTIVDELVTAGVRPDAVVVSVGGGGLMCGILEGMARHGWADVELIAVETRGAESLHASVQAGKRVTLPEITSLAKSLGATTVASAAYEWTRRHPVTSVVVSDRSAVSACFAFANRQRILVEPACGAALSLLHDQHTHLDRFDSVVVIVCGGIGVTLERLLGWAEQTGLRIDRSA